MFAACMRRNKTSSSNKRPLLLICIGILSIIFIIFMFLSSNRMRIDDSSPEWTHTEIRAPVAPVVSPSEISSSRTRDFHKEPIVLTLPRRESYELTSCDVRCKVSNQFNRPSDAKADVVGTIRIFTSANDPHRSISDLMEHYHVVATPSLDSDLPVPHVSWKNNDLFAKPKSKRNEDAPVVMLMSSCSSTNGRLEYAQQLMQHVNVHSYGECFNNKHSKLIANDFRTSLRDAHKKELTADYKFAVAFEPTDRDDYVSERFYSALEVGAVPIHYGCKGIHRFAPAPNSVLSAEDFPSARELAERIKKIAANDIEYNKMIAWKTNGTSPSFNSLVGHNNVDLECRMCIRVADLYRRNGVDRTETSSKSHLTRSLKVRSRGFFKLHDFQLDPPRTLASLQSQLTKAFEHLPKLPENCKPSTGLEPLHEIRLLGRDWLLRKGHVIKSDADVSALIDGDELELTWDWKPR